MLTLPIKKKWFDMILSGEKLMEYRDIKPYYTSRFKSVGLLDEDEKPSGKTTQIAFRNGYSSNSPSFIADVCLDIVYGYRRWGGEPSKLYYGLEILKIRDR